MVDAKALSEAIVIMSRYFLSGLKLKLRRMMWRLEQYKTRQRNQNFMSRNIE